MRTTLSDFICYLEDGGQIFDPELIKEYLEKEKQQIVDAYDLGMGHYGDANRRSDAEQYYNETFKND